MMHNLPSKFHKYYNVPGNFITYYSDIFSGFITDCPGYDDRIFIVQNDKSRQLRELTRGERTLEKYQELGWEIRDTNIIKEDVLQSHQSFQNNIKLNSKSRSGQKFKKWFVFGAGASSHFIAEPHKAAFRSHPLCPPECFDIYDPKFENYCRKYPGVINSTSSSGAFLFDKTKNIEDFFEEDWLKYRYAYNPDLAIEHLNIQFYLQDLFTDISEYGIKQFRGNLFSVFASKLQQYLSMPQNGDERIGIISFNYDTILDHFINNICVKKFDHMNNYFEWDHNKVALFKPHGSVNWGWKFDQKKLGHCNSASVSEYLYSNRIEPYQIYYHYLGDITEMLGSWGAEYHLHDNFLGKFTPNKNRISVIPKNTLDAYFPALLLPYRDKDEFIMPYDHYYSMDFILPDAEEIYLIGWKGNEKLFNRELKRKLKKGCKFIIVNPKADEVIQNLRSAGIDIDIKNGNVRVVEDFAKFIHQDIDTVLS
jgi:hypothetical protein